MHAVTLEMNRCCGRGEGLRRNGLRLLLQCSAWIYLTKPELPAFICILWLWWNKCWQRRSLEGDPLLFHFSSNQSLFTFLVYPLLPSTWKMPEFVIQDVVSGEYQDNTHLNVISIKARSLRKSKRVRALRLFRCTAEHTIFSKIKSFKIIYLPYQMNCRNFIESRKIGCVPCRILINSRKRWTV